MHSIAPFGHMRMVPGPGILPSYGLVWEDLSLFQAQRVFLCSTKCVHQWLSGTPPAFSISDSTEEGSRFYCTRGVCAGHVLCLGCQEEDLLAIGG